MVSARTKIDRFRDEVAMRTCNWILNTIATQWYLDWVEMIIERGKSSVEEDIQRLSEEYEVH